MPRLQCTLGPDDSFWASCNGTARWNDVPKDCLLIGVGRRLKNGPSGLAFFRAALNSPRRPPPSHPAAVPFPGGNIEDLLARILHALRRGVDAYSMAVSIRFVARTPYRYEHRTTSMLRPGPVRVRRIRRRTDSNSRNKTMDQRGRRMLASLF